MSNAYEEFMKQMVVPMRQELTRTGFEELTSEEDVENTRSARRKELG